MKQIETLTDSNKLPEMIKDFCHNGQRATTWFRQREVYKEHIREGVYQCECCEIERNYIVKGDSLKEKRI